MINQTLHTIKGLCNCLGTGLFIISLYLQIIESFEPYKHYYMMLLVVGWAIVISGWCINDKME